MSIKSPINRIGGKFFLKDWLVQYIPKHVCYVEPFAGAGHLLFAKSPSKAEVLNDINGHLINFFRVIKDHEKRQRLIETLQYMPYSRALWQELRANWKQGSIPGDPIEQAAQWYYLNRTCFGGDMQSGGFALPSVTGRNPALSYANSINTFHDIGRRLQGVTIESLAYVECIQRYDSPDTLFFCDPPYLNTEGYYGKENFAYDDHRDLASMLSMVKGQVVITHYQNGLYDELYKGWHKYEFQSFKGSHKADAGHEKPRTIEVLYTNFEPKLKTRSLFNGLQ